MSQFKHEIRNDIAWVTFDSGGMNTLSQAAITDLRALIDALQATHATTPLKGVVLEGNKFGLGAGANIGELMTADAAQLASFIDVGHDTLYRIEDGPFPWVALVDGFALGGIYELALACHGIIATEKSTVGFPEIRLNIFPGLGGTQRMPRRSGLINAKDPISGDAGFTAVLQGKNFRAKQAAAIHMIDAVISEGDDRHVFAEKFLTETLATIDRTPPADLANAESLRELIVPVVQKATMGRPNPRAPYVALDVMIKGAALPLKEANKLERDAFVEVATSAEGRAGMRFFFTQQSVQKMPKGAPKPRQLKKIGVDGIDGFMGNAIGWLALEAGYEVVGHVPLEKFAESVPAKLAAKYGRAVKKGAMSEDDVKAKVAKVKVTSNVEDLFDCDLVIEARMENKDVKAEFYRALGKGMKADGLIASNSSSMGPGMLGAYFAEGGGNTANFLNLHFFSPAENPIMQLVEIIRGAETTDEAVSTAHAFVRSINKTPVILNDGSAGFLVNAGLAAYMIEAEKLYREGTPVEMIDQAMRAAIFPMGPFELGDAAGLDTASGMFDTIHAVTPLDPTPIVWELRERKRFGIKTGAGVYDYDEKGKKTGVWPGLDGLVPDRGNQPSSKEQIVERCARALYDKARELLDRGIVGSAEECDLAFVFGIGFAMFLGGPIYYGQQQGWE